MMEFKPLLLKTYGKQRRRVSAWISPDNRKRAFDSSGSSNGSAQESPEGKKTSKRGIGVRKQRGAKEKARQCLAEKNSDDGDASDEENIRIPTPPPPSPQLFQPAKRSKAQTNVQIKKAFSGRKTRKRKDVQPLTETNNLEEKTESLCSSPAQLNPQSKTSSGQPPSVGRFVTRRRRAPVEPKRQKHRESLVNSSDDFTSGASRASRVHRPSRRRRNPPAFESSIDDNSLNAAGRSSFVFNPLQISPNELPDRGRRRYPHRPIFCSTPSVRLCRERASRKCPPINDQSALSSSASVSAIRDLSSSQENLGFSPHSPIKQQREPDLRNHAEPSALPSVTWLSTDNAETSQFVTASGGSEPLIEVLKEKCLTKSCTVQLERLDYGTVFGLCAKKTYSLCLEQSSSVYFQSTDVQPHDRSQPLDQSSGALGSLNLHLSLTNNSFQGQTHLKELDSATNSHSIIMSPLVDSKLPVNLSSTQVVDGRSSPEHEDDNFVIILDTPSPSRKVMPTHLNPEEVTPAKNESLRRESLVPVQKLSSALLSGTQEKEYTHRSGEMRSSAGKLKSKNPTGATELETVKDTAVFTALLKEKCLTSKLTVDVERATGSQLKEILRSKDATVKCPAESPSAQDEQMRSDPLSGNDSLTLETNRKNQGSASFQHIANEKEGGEYSSNVAPVRKKLSLAHNDKKTNTAKYRPGTARKACVSGLSVSRWKNKGSGRSADCSMTELISEQQRRPKEVHKLLGSTISFSTPLASSRLNLSSLMADLTPSTPTWSRLKSALSLHRKVLLTPKCLAAGSPDQSELADVSRDLFAMPVRTPISKRLQSQLRNDHSLVVCEDDLSDAEKVYAECGQQQPLSWEECILPQRMKKCVKIGEGTFGEVFSTTGPSGDTVALKVIPVEGAEKVNGEDQKTFGEILHEIIISKELSSLKEKQNNQTHGFIGLKDLHCVKGCYPPDFLKAWDAFDQRKCSENDRPDFFEEDQLFLILEFEFGGVDLENSNGTLASLVVAKSILHQVTAALAVAEQELHFEHRDLHWGNVLVKTTKEKTGSFLLNGSAQCVETKGVLVRIIDYSLSRLEIDNLTVSCDISNDEELFMGQGDYQFDIYRLMRQENGNNWSDYHPHTNVLWLHYLCSKLLSMKYRSSRAKNGKDVRKELNHFHKNVLQCSSATEVLATMFQKS